MEELLMEMESMKITGNSKSAVLWKKCIDVFLPPLMNGNDRPYREADFQEYRNSIDENLLKVRELLHDFFFETRDEAHDPEVLKVIVIQLLVIIGEQSERSAWNTEETVETVRNILADVCTICACPDLSAILCASDEKIDAILRILRPKLLKDTWKNYPGAVVCYKWLVNKVEVPGLAKYVPSILPTALIIFDDFIPENRIIGLECIYKILQHVSTQKDFMENGYGEVIYDALKKLTHQRDVRYIIPLFNCLTLVLAATEKTNEPLARFVWSKRDDVIETILDNMEMEQDLELRHAYMTSLPQLLTSLGCAKWLQPLIRVLKEYCSHHTDLRTLKATLQTAEVILTLFHARIPDHCTTLYPVFLRLHLDLTETPIFDEEIIRSLERCIYTLYQLTPDIGSCLMRDERLRMIIQDSLLVACTGDTKYCN